MKWTMQDDSLFADPLRAHVWAGRLSEKANAFRAKNRKRRIQEVELTALVALKSYEGGMHRAAFLLSRRKLAGVSS